MRVERVDLARREELQQPQLGRLRADRRRVEQVFEPESAGG